MCLKVKSRVRPEHAKMDIVCYKILAKHYNGQILTSPIWRECWWRIGETKFNFEEAIGCRIGNMREFGKGLFHVFTNKHDALQATGHDGYLNRANLFGVRTVLYECVIPKGTKYYTGVDGDGTLNYGTTALKIIKEVK